MKRSDKYVGLDVHQATTVSTVREETGRVLARSVVPTEAAALVEYFRGMRGAIHVAFEEGTQAQWLHDLLTPIVHRVVVCNRRGQSKGTRAISRTRTSCRTCCGAGGCARCIMAAPSAAL